MNMIILALLMISAGFLLLCASSQPHMLNPEHSKIRHPSERAGK